MKNLMKSFLVLFCAAMLGVSGCSKEPAPAGPSSTTGTITGRVIDYSTGAFIGGVVVSSIPPSQSVTSDANGLYKMSGVTAGTYNLRAVKNGYSDGFAAISVSAGQSITADIVMHPGVAGNHPPSVPGAPVPADNSINQPLSLTLRWASSDPDNDPVTYDVYFGTSNPPNSAVATGISASSHAQANLDSNTTYYWFVVAKDDKGGVSVGPVWRFKTLTPGGNPQGDAANALDFQGTNGYEGKDNTVRVPYDSDFSLSDGNFTVEAWVRLSRSAQYQWIASKAQSNNNADWLIGFVNGRLHMAARNAATTVTAPTDIQPGQWYHVAGVFDVSSDMVMLYINGQLMASTSISGTPVANSRDMLIGGREFQGVPSEGFQGVIHDLRIWNIARSQSDLSATRLQRLNGNEQGLIGYWPLNDGSGTVAADHSGKGHDGQFLNNPKWVKVVLPIP